MECRYLRWDERCGHLGAPVEEIEQGITLKKTKISVPVFCEAARKSGMCYMRFSWSVVVKRKEWEIEK